MDFSDNNPYFEKGFDFYDKRLLDAVRNEVPGVHEFFRLLALCHTVVSSEKKGEDGLIDEWMNGWMSIFIIISL